MSSTNSPEEPKSRLDRELNEILEQARSRPISFQDHVARKRNAVDVRKRSGAQSLRRLKSGPARTAGRWLLKVPLATALVLALLAVWLAPEYELLGGALAVAAALLIFLPYVLKRPERDFDTPTRWRGRIVSGSPPAASGRGPRSWLDSARDRFGR